MKSGLNRQTAMVVGIGLLGAVALLLWHASQPIVKDGWEQSVGQAARKTHAQPHQKALAQPPVALPSAEAEDVDAAVDAVVDEMLTWLDSLEEESSEEGLETPDTPISEQPAIAEVEEERFYGLTREEIEVAIPTIEQQIRTNLTYAVDLYTNLRSTDGVARHLPRAEAAEMYRWREETWKEFKQVIRDTGPLGARYKGYLSVMGRDPSEGMAWIHELMSPLPVRFE